MDPFETTWPLLRQWFDAEPERTGRELFERLQAEHPGVYPDGQLRTLQRRLKGWRREAARRLVFATPPMEPGFGTGAEGRCYRATGEDKAPESLETTDGVSHAAAE